MNNLALTRLLQLCNPNLPIGGFSFSQGLESAIEKEWITNPTDLNEWVSTMLFESLGNTDLPLLAQQRNAIQSNDYKQFEKNEQLICATRETSEILMAEQAMGTAMLRLLKNLKGINHTEQPLWLTEFNKLSFISSFAIASHYFQLDIDTTLTGYAWTFIDFQIAAAVKLIPLGQTDGQNLLFEIAKKIPDCVTQSQSVQWGCIGQSLPGLAIASSWHEQQYSRLFRS